MPGDTPKIDWVCKFCKGQNGQPFRNFGSRSSCFKCNIAKCKCFAKEVPGTRPAQTLAERQVQQQKAADKRGKAANASAGASELKQLRQELEVVRGELEKFKVPSTPQPGDDGMGELSAEQADRQKVLRAELKELKAVSPALHKRFFGGADGHAAAVQAIQDELTAVAAAKRGGMPLADQLDSQRRFVDACVKADSVAKAQLDALLVEREKLEEQITAGRSAREKAAEKRASAEAHLAELHSRMALEAVPATASAARPPSITVEDTRLFMGILQHVDAGAIRATCQATGGETVEQVSSRVAALTAKLSAIAAAAAASMPPAGSRAAGSAGEPCRVAAPAAEAAAGEGEDDQSMLLDAEEQEQRDKLDNDLDDEATGAGGSQLASRVELRERLVQQTARMVSKRLKAKKSA